MPIVRIDPTPGKGRKRQTLQGIGASIGKAFGGPGLELFGAWMGDSLGKLLSKGEPVFPLEVDTETNKLTVLTPDWSKSVNTKSRILAPKLEARTQPIRDALQAVWDTGAIPDTLPKRYRAMAGELLQQRAILFREIEPAPVSPIETEGAQYPLGGNVPIVPPGGFAGFAQMTPASKYAQGISKLGKLARRLSKGRKKRKAKAGGKRRRKAKAGGKRKARLVKGSAAAKRYMAALRRKRK